MSYSISLTGITQLTKTRYKARHSGSKEIVQIPKQGFRLRERKDRQDSTLRRSKKGYSKKLIKKESFQTKQPKIKQYTINKKEVSHRIRNYVNQMKGEKMLYFWTVTFPLKTTDSTAFILLNKWLTRLRQEKMIKEYLWISERQQNGTIHFHIVINRKMNVQKANRYMRASIMHSINKKEIQYSRTEAMKYNGVDIAKDRKTRRVINFAKQNKQKALTNYLTKYVTKNDQKFEHLAWHSSREYSNLIIAIRFTEREIKNSDILNRTDQLKPLTGEFYIHYKWKSKPPDSLLSYLSQLNQHLQNQFN